MLFRSYKKESNGGSAFSATRIDDPKLVEDLDQATVKYAGETINRWPQELLGWLFPVLLLFGIWSVSRRMSTHSALKVIGAFLWACIIGTLCAGAVVSALLFRYFNHVYNLNVIESLVHWFIVLMSKSTNIKIPWLVRQYLITNPKLSRERSEWMKV